MTTRRSGLLTLALFALLIATTFVRNVMAAPGTPPASGEDSARAAQTRYFAPVHQAFAGQSSSSYLGLMPSAAVNRQFTRDAATLRAHLGLASTDPVASEAIYPTHAANRALLVADARAQAARVAKARALPTATVLALIDQYTERFAFGGDAQVNLRMLNIALDELE